MNKKETKRTRLGATETVPQAGVMPGTTSGGASKAALTQREENEMQTTETASADPSDAALVAVIRIFAARGRAIREERAKNGISSPVTTQSGAQLLPENALLHLDEQLDGQSEERMDGNPPGRITQR
jgi:hypothetical protein